MDSFGMYFEIGLRYIADISNVGHMLFILALISVYQLIELKRVIFLVLAFILGLSITLTLSAYHIVKVDSVYVTFLIPITILITALYHLVQGRSASKRAWGIPVAMTLIFGLIHGLELGAELRAMLADSSDILVPMLAFNLGVEAGLIGIVILVFVVANLLFQIFRFKRRDWILVVSGFAIGASALLLSNSIYW